MYIRTCQCKSGWPRCPRCNEALHEKEEESKAATSTVSPEDQLLVQFAKEELAKDEEHRASIARKEERKKIREERRARASERVRERESRREQEEEISGSDAGGALMSAIDPRTAVEVRLQGLIQDSLKGLVEDGASSYPSQNQNGGKVRDAGREPTDGARGPETAEASAHDLGIEVLRGVREHGEESRSRRRRNGHGGDRGPLAPDNMRAPAALNHETDASDMSFTSHASRTSRRSRRSDAAERLEHYLMRGDAAAAGADASSVTRERRGRRGHKARERPAQDSGTEGQADRVAAGRSAQAGAASNKHSSFDLGNEEDAHQFQEWLHGKSWCSACVSPHHALSAMFVYSAV